MSTMNLLDNMTDNNTHKNISTGNVLVKLRVASHSFIKSAIETKCC